MAMPAMVMPEPEKMERERQFGLEKRLIHLFHLLRAS